ncbi:hypothetical protein [Streptomyces liliifuscus]|uniref:Uncharacterized protein n=1 Tax=Streptomyces liliifuscus TaxID=2797636 RepID=A0A7T7I6L5_9ACTN|nr:hypothetical protein [Streptomyces liliifuscus]QQM41985.1 hypothetical protein JEQ17_22760 [Streptomyces liliifuscus]
MTEQEIAEAEAAAEEAEAKLDRAEQYQDTSGSKQAVNEFRAAHVDAHAARDYLRRLRSVWAREQAGQARREAAEAALAKKRGKTVARLTEGRDRAAEAVAVLDRAAAEALAAVAAYTTLVQSTAGELRAAGLRHDDGGVEGGATDGSVYLTDGGVTEVWRPASGPDMLGALVSAAVAAHDQRHPLAKRWRHSGGLAQQAGAEALLKAVAR